MLQYVKGLFVLAAVVAVLPEVRLCSRYSLRQTLSWKNTRKSLHCSLWLPLAAQEHQGPTLEVELSR